MLTLDGEVSPFVHGTRVEVVHFSQDPLDRAVMEGKDGFIKRVGLRGLLAPLRACGCWEHQ